MGAKRVQYQIVGRYMNGNEITGYHLQSLESNKSGRYTREQVIYLVGRDQITNCVGQIYQDKVLLRGKGVSLDDLPVQQESGEITRTDNVGHVRRGVTGEHVMEQFLIVATIKSGKNTVGYRIQNAGGGVKDIDRNTLIKLAENGSIGNARVQRYNGVLLLRGLNCNLNAMPSVQLK